MAPSIAADERLHFWMCPDAVSSLHDICRFAELLLGPTFFLQVKHLILWRLNGNLRAACARPLKASRGRAAPKQFAILQSKLVHFQHKAAQLLAERGERIFHVRSLRAEV